MNKMSDRLLLWQKFAVLSLVARILTGISTFRDASPEPLQDQARMPVDAIAGFKFGTGPQTSAQQAPTLIA